jgi:hypothetical protein
MTSHASAIAERLRDAAERIPVDTDPARLNAPAPGRPRRSSRPRSRPSGRRRALVAGGVAVALTAAATGAVVAIAVTDGTDGTGNVETGPAAAPGTSDLGRAPSEPVAAHVASPPDWFGEPRAGYSEPSRTGRWVTMAIGRQSDGGGIAAPITIAAFDGTHRLLDDAESLEVDGTTLRSVRMGGWQALATDATPTVMVSGIADEQTLAAVLTAADVTGPSDELSLRLTSLPAGYDEIAAPRVHVPETGLRPALSGDAGATVIYDASDWNDPLSVAAGSGADISPVDVDGTTGWIGLSTEIRGGPVRSLVWSPGPGVVFELVTTDMDRSEADLVDLARATTPLDRDEWDELYGG